MKVAFAQRHLKRLHVEPIAGQHAGLVSEALVGRGLAAAHGRLVDDVVVHQRRRVNDLGHRREAHGRLALVAERAGEQKHQDGTQPLAAAGLQMVRDGADGVHRADRVELDRLFDLEQVVGDQSQHFLAGKRLGARGLRRAGSGHQQVQSGPLSVAVHSDPRNRNSLRKLAVVATASVSNSSPRVSASRLAVSTTKRGSLRRILRCGSGVR